MQLQRIDSLRQPPIGFAHRGARADAPENTVDAFALALEMGATGLETDAWITGDGQIVLDHDGVVRTGLRKKPISQLARTELPAHIPTLGELYDHCGIDFELSVDVKDSDAVAGLAETARTAGADGRMWLCHADVDLLASWRPTIGAARLVNSTRRSRLDESLEQHAARLARLGIDAINLRRHEWSGGLTTLFHRFDRYCFGWDAQHERMVIDLVRMGIDGVYSDHVGRMMTSLHAAAGT